MRKKITLALLSLLLVPLGMMAQDVTVRSDNGNTLPAVKSGGNDDSFYDLDGFALWKHNQLNLTMTTADAEAAQMENGQFTNAANNIFKATGSKSLIIGRGRLNDTYMALTLPKGYRFTGYRIVFRRNANIEDGANGQATFGEVSVTNDDAKTPIWTTYRPNTDEEVYSVSGLSYNQNASRNRITRTSKTDDDMGNTLYFKLTNSERAFITLDTLKLEFTAEADYTPLNAGSKKYLNRTAVDIPFSTSTVDLGTIDLHAYGTHTPRMSYKNPTNLMANLQLFQEEGGTENGTNYDGTSGKVVKYADNGTISTEGNYFKIGKNDGQEHFYYIETPTYVQLNDYDKTKNPIGYRIVGAKINYTYGKARTNSETYTNTEEVIVAQKTYPTFTVSQTLNDLYEWNTIFIGGIWSYVGTKTYYLTSSGGMSDDESSMAVWFRDDDGYIRLAGNPNIYLKNGSNNVLEVTENVNAAAKYNIDESTGKISILQNSNIILCLNAVEERHNFVTHLVAPTRFRMINNGSYPAPRTLTGENKVLNIYGTETETLVFPPFSPSNFTLKLYDKDGKVLANTDGVEQSVEVKNGTADGYLEVNGLNNDAVKIGIIGVGLIDGSLTIQALDPYIDQMSVVCQDQAKPEIKLTQGFTASDFGMSGENGGVFHFYLPKQCAKDGDLVKITFEDLYSHYGDESYTNGSAAHTSRYNFVRSEHFDKLGLSNNWLYADTAEVAHPKLERLKVDMLGSKAFTFNNSATVGKNGGTLTEYPFTLEKYKAQGGTFEQLTFTVSEEDQNQKKYVFTTDETAYNISPATATQHRTYAFYTFEVHVQSGTYEPKVEFVPIYKKGDDLGVTGTVYGNRQRDNFYGAVVTAVDGDGKPGFASTTEVNALIDKMITEDKEDSFGHTDIPDNANKLLYIDFSQLKGVYQTGDNQQLINKNAANCIIFVPEGAAGPVNNVAAKDGNVFKASRNIVLTDKQPFYIPYDIQVNAAQKAYYEREITTAHNGKVTSASIILPFAITVDDDGKHTNVDEDTWAFSLHEMKTNGNCLGGTAEGDAPAYAYFPAVSGVTSSQPNRPYIVKVNTENVPEGDNISFICSQAGALLKATTGMDKSDYTFKGTTSTGIDSKDGNNEMTFTYYGSYSGRLLPYDQYYYYYASNMFVRSNEYKYKTSIRVTPFRAFYATEGGSKARSLTSFDLFFGEGDTPDGIHAVENSWQGIDVNAPVYDLQGRKLADSLIGTTLKRGIYVINGQKFTVK